MRKLVLAILVLLSSCHHKKALPSRPSYPVTMTEAVAKPMDIFIEALGHVEPMISVDIRSRIEGELTGVYFTQGQEVKKGDLLFTIDPKPYEALLKQAKGALEETLANLALAEEKVKRYRTLAKDEYYSQIDYETLQSNYAALLAQAQQNGARVDEAAINLDYCWIYAPIDGKTGILQIDFGNLIKEEDDTPLVTLNQMAPIFVTFSIPEFQLQQIRSYQKKNELKIDAAFEDFDKEVFHGSLYMVDNGVDEKTGMVKIRALFENTCRDLWPGQFIRTRLILTTLSNATVIPHAAIQMTRSDPIVFVLNEDKTVSQRKVKLGQRKGEEVIVLEGVKAGEKIVLEGQLNLSEGTKVFMASRKK